MTRTGVVRHTSCCGSGDECVPIETPSRGPQERRLDGRAWPGAGGCCMQGPHSRTAALSGLAAFAPNAADVGHWSQSTRRLQVQLGVFRASAQACHQCAHSAPGAGARELFLLPARLLQVLQPGPCTRQHSVVLGPSSISYSSSLRSQPSGLAIRLVPGQGHAVSEGSSCSCRGRLQTVS